MFPEEVSSIPTIVTDLDRPLMTEPVALVVNDDDERVGANNTEPDAGGDYVDEILDDIVEDAADESVEDAVVEIVAGPDRADAPVSLVTERFLKVIVDHVPLRRLEELHLFSPLRQGGVETGIAVIAARPLEQSGLTAVSSELPFTEAEAPVAEPVRERHTVYTARYRLTLKGPDRGKWEADVVAEADAPLITVEMVVRGVQRRAGEDSEILRFSAKQVAHAVQVAWPLPEIVVERAAEAFPDIPQDADQTETE